MMYLSQLLIDTGGNPDRPRPGRKWLGNIYNVHRRLCMAFPQFKRDDDPNFLQPFDPGQYKHPDRPFLFRVDNNINGDASRAFIIVQSELPPDWEWCFHNAPDFLAAPPQIREYDPNFTAGQLLRFRIRINPSVKRVDAKKEEKIKCDKAEKQEEYAQPKQNKRVAFTWDSETTPDDAMADWFIAKSSGKGFTPQKTELLQLSWVYGSKPYPVNVQPKQNGQGYWREHEYHQMRYRSALMEGFLCVDEPHLFLESLRGGIGSARSMGFGLLSVIPAKNA